MRLSRPSLFPHQREKKKAAAVAESQVRWQQLQWVASVYNMPHLIVINSNGFVAMEIEISHITRYWKM